MLWEGYYIHTHVSMSSSRYAVRSGGEEGVRWIFMEEEERRGRGGGGAVEGDHGQCIFL